MTFTKNQANAIRSIVYLPDDDWTPCEWDTFEAARRVLRSELEAQDRAAYRRLAEKERTAPNRVRSVSKRRVPPAAKQALVERSGGLCEVADPKVCGGSTLHRATHVHHLAGRVGPAPHRLSNLLHVCHTAHEWIHAHPNVSYAKGWMVKRNGVQA